MWGSGDRFVFHSLLQVGAVQVDATGGRGRCGDVGQLLCDLILVLLGQPPVERTVPVCSSAAAATRAQLPLQRLVATGRTAAAVRHIHVRGRADHHLGGRR